MNANYKFRLYARFWVLITVLLKMKVFCEVMLCHWVNKCQSIKGSGCLQNVGKHSANDTLSLPTRRELTIFRSVCYCQNLVLLNDFHVFGKSPAKSHIIYLLVNRCSIYVEKFFCDIWDLKYFS